MTPSPQTPTFADSSAIIFYFFLWGFIFWMVVDSFAYAAHAMHFSWLTIIALATPSSYYTVWVSKYGG